MKFFCTYCLMLSLALSASDFSLMTGWEKLSEQNACPSIDSHGVVMGVNVITGSYHDSSTDFVSKGIDPIRVGRSYFREQGRPDFYADLDSPNVLGWYLNYEDLFFADAIDAKQAQNILVSHASGSLLHFTLNHHAGRFCFTNFKGFMNDSSSLLSGQNHLRNAYISYPSSKRYEVHFPDGSMSCFQMPKNACRSPARADILGKRNPTGSIVQMENGKMVTRAPDGTILNWIKIIKAGSFYKIETCDNRDFYLTPTKNLDRTGGVVNLLNQFIYPDGSSFEYSYNTHPTKGNDFISGKRLPDGRYLKVFYYKWDSKVERLEGPIGSGGTNATLYRFSYGEGFTDVYDANGNQTRYEYDKENRITRVLKYDGKTLLRIEKNVWDGIGCLLGKILCTPDGKPILARTFEYDERGNVLTEKFWGTLTGLSTKRLELGSGGLPKDNGADCYVKRYTYHPDEFNLLASESDGFSTTEYAYVPNTNLLASKFVYNEKKELKLRQFRGYDSLGALGLIIEDDGNSKNPYTLTGCSIRKIKRMTNRKEFPGVGQPECVEELYYDFDEAQVKLLRKVVFHYDTHNDPIQEDVYGEKGELAYVIKRRYDLMGRCIYETDPLGNEIFRTFDANGNLVKEVGPNPKVEIEHGYDFANRKIWTRQKGEEGNIKSILSRYDLIGACVSKIDERGNETVFVYDGLSRKTEEIYPQTMSGEGVFKNAKIGLKYDLLDHVIESIDEEGNRILIDYNIRGQPFKIKTLFFRAKYLKSPLLMI